MVEPQADNSVRDVRKIVKRPRHVCSLTACCATSRRVPQARPLAACSHCITSKIVFFAGDWHSCARSRNSGSYCFPFVDVPDEMVTLPARLTLKLTLSKKMFLDEARKSTILFAVLWKTTQQT